MNLLQRLENAQKIIDTADREIAQSQGRLAMLNEQLKKAAGTDDPKKVEALLSQWKKEQEEKEGQLEKLLDELEAVCG